ncbi:ras and Rab interactor 3 [Lampris incognitus]|uniref:ras and Rab interactor 3 n=1 Tax=Lampris incognitus TaxID=2546036 RepID=UPI0024B4AC85|nr:ras and Rab interactor 3 [Lampris incognitus]
MASLNLAPSLPPPVSPTLSSSPPPLPPLLPAVPQTLTPAKASVGTPPTLGLEDKLVGSTSVWWLKGVGPDHIASIMERETAGAFLVHSLEEQAMTLSVCVSDRAADPSIHHVMINQHKTFLHLEGSSLIFDDIFKLVSFYCVSRDILPVKLRLPWAISRATKRDDLDTISTMGADFWASALNLQAEEQPDGQRGALDLNQSGQPSLSATRVLLWYINPVTVEEHMDNLNLSDSDLQSTTSCLAVVSKPRNVATSSAPKLDSALSSSSSNLQDRENDKKSEVRASGKLPAPNLEALPRYKRPPPRPPSLSAGIGSVPSSSPAVNSPSSPTQAADRKEEGSGGERRARGGEREEKKLVSTSSPPSRPPVPSQGRVAPRLHAAPRQLSASRKCAEGTGEKERTPKSGQGEEERERGEGENKETLSTSMEDAVKQENSPGGSEREEGKDERQVKTDKESEEEIPKSSSDFQAMGKKPLRPVPPPRRKQPAQPASSLSPIGGGPPNQSAGTRPAVPTKPRPDVSLYSPQGGAVLGTDPDSCSNSSTEEDGEPNQGQELNQGRGSDSRSPKVAVKRTPTTVILDRARHRLSTVLTGLISHDRRLTQRIVELARDPMSYFGNLVKEHRTFTLETMSRHTSSTELLQEIRQMVTQLKSYLLQSTELQVMLEPQHQYTQEKLETIVEAALCKSVLKPLREPIYRSLEKLHKDDGGLQQLSQNQSLVLGSTTTALGVTTAVPEAPALEKIGGKLNSLHLEYSPQRKIELLLKTCKIIYDSMSVSCQGRSHGADDFLPVMMYVLARSNLADLQLDVEYMMELMDPSLTLGEGSYYLTTTYGALEHIKNFDQQRGATRQLSREVQDSIHSWERRRTLNKERMALGSIQDFLTVCCPQMGHNMKTMGVAPSTTIQQLEEQCAARFEQDSYTLSVCVEGVYQPLAPTELVLAIKNSLTQGSYCFVYHPSQQGDSEAAPFSPVDEPLLHRPAESCCPDSGTALSSNTAEEEDHSLISL